MSSAIRVAIDRSGRLVVPKPVRDAAGIEPGMPLAIRVRDGRIEIEPVYEDVRRVERLGFEVAERSEDVGPELSTEAVRAAQERLRTREPGA